MGVAAIRQLAYDAVVSTYCPKHQAPSTKFSRHTSFKTFAGTGNMTGQRDAQLEGAGKIALDRSPMEIIGRPRRLPPVSGRNGTERRLQCAGSFGSGPQQPIAALVEGKLVAMRGRKTVTAWPKGRSRGAVRSMEAT